MKMNIFSFFSGSGFLDLGFEQSGYDIKFVNEYLPSFMNAYQYSREQMKLDKPEFGYQNNDINDFLDNRKKELKDFVCVSKKDALTGFIGGPPCPDFSVAGKNKGKEGDNGKLSLSYVNSIVTFNPDFFLFENVKGLWRTARHRAYFEDLKKILHAAGYCTTERLTNSLEFGAPQDRDRILLFGMKKKFLKSKNIKRNEILNFPWESKLIYSMEDIQKCKWPTEDIFKKDGKINQPKNIIPELTVEYWFKKNDVLNHPNGNDFLQPKAGLVKMKVIKEGDVSKKCYKRLHRWRYSPTAAYGNNEVHLHPYKERRLSVAETLAIQSLPKEFVLPPEMTLTAKFKTVGNGVPYLMGKGMAETIKKFLEDL